jgi:alpha-amylase
MDDLQAGQSNDPSWHGLFGGIYLPDLRVANLRHLIRAEDAALRAGAGTALGVASGSLTDLDLDGRDEILLFNDGEIVAIKPDDGAGIGRWDVRAAAVPLAAVMRRRPEAYHDKVRAHDAPAPDASAASAEDGESAAGGAPASIHDLVMVKQEGLAEHLRYDRHERRSGLVRILPADVTVEAWVDGTADDLVPAVDAAWTVGDIAPDCATTTFARDGVRSTRTVRLGGDRRTPTLAIELIVANERAEPVEARIGLEFALMLLGGGHNPGAWWEIGEERFAHDERRVASGVDRLGSGNEALGVEIATTFDGPADAWIEPIETVSNSEAGFELVYQGSALLVSRIVRIAPGQSARVMVTHAVLTAGSGE